MSDGVDGIALIVTQRLLHDCQLALSIGTSNIMLGRASVRPDWIKIKSTAVNYYTTTENGGF
jgi:hypothetical protein